ncbi:MAG: YicC/YloC family endoribonuclease [Pseudomonadota bacterium]
MTAYATRSGASQTHSWQWEMRGVNGRGLDIRLRLPDWIDGLEAEVRRALTAKLGRGNIQVSLKLQRVETGASQINEAAVAQILAALKAIEAMAASASVPLAPTKAADILSMRAVGEGDGDAGKADLVTALKEDIPELIAAFSAMRAEEGASLAQILGAQIDEIEELVHEAKALLPDRRAAQEATFRAALARVMAETPLDEAKFAQEIAQIAIKSDVTEEIDRLVTHIAAARALLSAKEPIGRKLDFLTQEFNREANTLCAKSADSALTKIGLALKIGIDRMREQVQNLE